MQNHIRSLLCLAACLTAGASTAQFLNYGVDPLRFKWNEARLEHYRLIYPRGLDSLAREYAEYLENVYEPVAATMGKVRISGFPVVLHPADMTSNGVVAWAPRRMELLTTPSTRLHAEPWSQHLTVHESRHVIQTAKMEGGFFKPFYRLLGEQATGLSSGIVPKWFFEGDAVGIETALTDAGRGRLPEFRMIYRAQMLLGSFYSFDKWNLGSYRDGVGTFYTLGYFLTSYARYRYGADIWNRTTSSYTARPLSFRPFSSAFKKHSGIGLDELFGQTFNFLRKEWEEQDSGYVEPEYLGLPPKSYTSYQYPQPLNDSTVIALRSGIADISAIVELSGGRERRIAYTGTVAGKIELRNNRVYYAETTAGMRWTHERSSRIRRLDLATGKPEWFAPRYGRASQFAAGDKYVALSLVNEDNTGRIVMINAGTEAEEASVNTPPGMFVKEMSLGNDGLLYTVTIDRGGISLHRVDVGAGSWEKLLGPTPLNISSLLWSDGRLLFESGASGVNNIYSYNPGDNTLLRLTSSRFGAFQPAMYNGKLFFSDYQGQGHRLAAMPADSLCNLPADFGSPRRFALADALSSQEGYRVRPDSFRPVDFRPRPYRKAARLFNVHSWAPLYFNMNDMIDRNADAFVTAVKPGAMVISQNALNTAISQAAWYYDKGYHHGVAHFTYMGFLPVINLRADYGGRAYDMTWVKEGNETSIASVPSARPLLNVEVGAYVPLSFNSGPWVRGLRPAASWVYSNNRYQQYNSRRMPWMQYVMADLLMYSYRRMATRELLPRWGAQLRLRYMHMPFQPDNMGDLYSANLTGYLPGLLRSHSLMLRAGWQYQDLGGKALYNHYHLIDAPRGQSVELRTQRQILLRADYAFPILTPDVSIGTLAYIRRIRANLFADVSLNKPKASSAWDPARASYGSDILFDWNALRLPYPLQTGARLVYPSGREGMRVQLLSSISF
jgi:hypothetical protein